MLDMRMTADELRGLAKWFDFYARLDMQDARAEKAAGRSPYLYALLARNSARAARRYRDAAARMED